MSQWNRNTVPKCKENECSDEVLVTVENKYCTKVLKAIYIPYHHCTTDDIGWNMSNGIPSGWEYNNDNDSWWIPEGWFEVCEYIEDYTYFPITDKVIAWMKLPKPYKPTI